MKNNIFFKMSAILIASVIVLGGCGESVGKKGSGIVSETAGANDIPKTIKPVKRFWLQWSGSNIPRPGSASTCAWDWKAASIARVNLMTVHYLAHDESGKTLKGLPDPERFAAELELMKYEINESHKNGVAVTGYADAAQFDPDVAKKLGYTLEQLGAKKADGNYIFTNAWNDGCYIACINSPEWRSWQKELMRLTAEAGFDGQQYDFHPLAAAGLFCRCDNCKRSWANYSKNVFGNERSIPADTIDMQTELGREYMKWKIGCFADFMKETVSEAKKINPDFLLVMNQNANGYFYSYEGLFGAWDQPSSEFWNSDNGYSSTLYMYQLTEALGYTEMYGIYNSSSFMEPTWRAKVNLAESYAVIGGMTYVNTDDNFGKLLFKFIENHEEIYQDYVVSRAKAAVLYSAESNLASVPSDKLNLSGQLFDFTTDQARRAASALLKCGVSYDYLVTEKEDAAEKLAQYDLLVVPDYQYFADEHWSGLLKSAANAGKRILVIGKTAKKYVASLGLPDRADVINCPSLANYPTEREFTVREQFADAVADTPAAKLVSLKNNLSNTAATVRSAGDGKTYIHVVRRGGEDNSESLYEELTYTPYDGKTVTGVTAYCPYKANAGLDAEWSFENGTLTVKTGDFDTYAVICVETN